MLNYEKYILGEITIDEFRARQAKIRQAVENQEATEFKIEKCERAYQRLSCMRKVRDKQLSLSAIMDEVSSITVDAARKIMYTGETSKQYFVQTP